ncbi:MAG TPA: YCF48-related protein [Bacteroidia bacterium]|nr:YCF48-related protein [Bacteroidia bacterium]
MKKSLLFFTWVSLCLTVSNQLNAQQWIAQSSNINPNNYVQFIDAVDTNVVWGLSSDRNSQQNPVQEFTRTTNGGLTWTAGTITNAANHGPSCIMALNADTAWVAMFNVSGGGSILRTNDGGVSWTKQTTATFTAPNGFPNVVHFFNANEGFCMGDPNGGYFEIYTTTDGGNNWIRVPQANIAANLTGEFGITDVYTNYGDSTVYFGTNKGRIYNSTDRGMNWTVSSTPYTGFIGAITFRDANFGIACEADNATTSTDLIVTNDGGATWSLLPTSSAGFTMKQSIRYVPGTDSTFVITSPYTIYGSAFSIDNGVNWRLMDNLIHSDCDFVNATTGWSGGGI